MAGVPLGGVVAVDQIDLTKICKQIMAPTKRVSVLVPTRKRPAMMFEALKSLWKTVSKEDGVEYLIALDDDDQESIDYFEKTIIPYMDKKKIDYEVHVVPRWGYTRLNEYLNYLASKASGAWYLFFNDDARMKTKDWDKIIYKHTGDFRILRVKDNHEHPYAIFPIIPYEWYVLCGYISPQQMTDAWVSQVAYLCGIMENEYDIDIFHDRHDITGNPETNDEIFTGREQLEGNPDNPMDLNSNNMTIKRYTDCAKIMWFLKQKGDYNDHFEKLITGKGPAWDLLQANDPHGLTKRVDHGEKYEVGQSTSKEEHARIREQLKK